MKREEQIEAYIDLGWHLLPVQAKGKRPATKLVPHGHLDATNDLDTVLSWYEQHPDLNLGIACEASGLLVIDFDFNKLDEESSQLYGQMDLEHYEGTLTVRTGRGVHYYFQAPMGLTVPGKLGAGIDVKYRGYVVAPPSVHANGKRYETVNDEMEPKYYTELGFKWVNHGILV
jgi:hypothetical protein